MTVVIKRCFKIFLLALWMFWMAACAGSAQPLPVAVTDEACCETPEPVVVAATPTTPLRPQTPTPTNTAVPTTTHTPPPTATATHTPTPTATPHSQLAVGDWSHLDVISPENAAELVEIGRWDLASSASDLIHSLSPDGRWVLSRDLTTLQGWDVATGAERFFIDLEPLPRRWGLALSPNGRFLATSHSDGRIYLWDAADGRQLLEIEAHLDGTNGLVFSPDSSLLASSGKDTTAAIWDVATGELVQRITLEMEPLYLMFSRDATQLATSLPLVLWDINTGAELTRIEDGWTIEFGVDNQAIFTKRSEYGLSSPMQVALPDGEMRAALWDLPEDEITGFWMDGDGRYLAIGYRDLSLLHNDDGPLFEFHWLLWDMAQAGKHVEVVVADERIDPLGFSPDGRLVASTASSGEVQLRDVNSGELLVVLPNHTQPGHGLAPVTMKLHDAPNQRSLIFTEDGRLLVTKSFDGSIRFWGVAAP